ncbi:MAG: type IV pilus modification PilV family protein [Jatrophihabitans sp.]|uniref:type IV pilus modification PilV family protein n=1 Tax=Jatrophihabitans sp. TaxID=1932789 RepID=UPI003F8068EE
MSDRVRVAVSTVRPARRPLRGPDEASDAGFSLIEVLVAMVLFVIVATVSARAIVDDMVSAKYSRQRTQASTIAQSLLAGFQRDKTVPSTFPTTVNGYGVRIAVNPAGTCATGGTRTVSILVYAPGVSTSTGAPSARTDSVLAC